MISLFLASRPGCVFNLFAKVLKALRRHERIKLLSTEDIYMRLPCVPYLVRLTAGLKYPAAELGIWQGCDGVLLQLLCALVRDGSHLLDGLDMRQGLTLRHYLAFGGLFIDMK